METVVEKFQEDLVVKIPEVLESNMGLIVGDTLECEVKEDSIILKKSQKTETVEKLFENYDGEAVEEQPILFETKGNEKW